MPREACKVCGCKDYDEMYAPTCHLIEWCHSLDYNREHALRLALLRIQNESADVNSQAQAKAAIEANEKAIKETENDD